MTVRHIVQQSSGYCFRMVVPADLRPVIGKRELRYSLRERSLLHAKQKAYRISTQVKGLFAKLRNGSKKGNANMDQAQINRLIRNMIKISIAEMEHEKATGKMLSRGELNEYLNDLDLFEHDYREALSLRDFRLIYPAVDRMIEDGNLDVKKGSEGYAGKHQEAVGFAEQAIRLNPMPTGFYFRNLAITYMFTGRYEEAIANFKKAIKIAPNDRLTHINMAVAYIEAGMEDEARAAVAEVLRINPKFSLTGVVKTLSYKNKADRDMFINALRKAGVSFESAY